MISVQPRTDTRRGVLFTAVVIAAIAIGFVAGQVTPDLLSTIPGSSTVTSTGSTTVEVGPLADYGLRHQPAAAALTQADDYALRHATPAVLGPADDYGLRHGPGS
jgi:hypothetical protein